ncbi:MAG: S9 family peptidase [Sphingobacteriales bacterium]|nr:MAG: S9 family peptidase [Sphingobacteriales bacterium]
MRYICLLLLLIAQTAIAQTKKQITLEDIWKDNTFKIKSVPGFNAMNDGKTYTQIDEENGRQVINAYDLATGNKLRNIYANSGGYKIDSYEFSSNEQKLLLKCESQNIYRRSILYKVYVYDTKTQNAVELYKDKVLHATFSPDGNKVAFVSNNDLYIRDLSSGVMVPVTKDGQKNKVINGNCDWVYEEEFEFTRAFDWAPDSKHIAYYRFDETNVPSVVLPMYKETELYPENYIYKYPKAGQPNSIVEIKLYDVATEQTVNADLGTETDQYIPRIKWTTNASKLCIYRMNRLQNKLELLLTDVATGANNIIYTEENRYYVEVNDNLEFLKDGSSFIFNSEKDGYNHLYHYDWKKKKTTLLTPGNYDIADIIGVNEANKQVYYTAAKASPMERKLYSVGFNGKGEKALTAEAGTHAITVVGGYNFFLDKYSTLTTPPVYYLRDAKGNIVRTLEDNADLKAKMNDYDLGKVSFKQFKIESGETLNAWMITPSTFDEHQKYPVLMYQYSGPGSQEVADRFPVRDFFWHQMLAEKGYIVVCVDGTGTGYRGEEFKKKTYLQLGKYESDDQIATAKYLGTLPYVDKARIGIWGWSYGGFMSSTCIFKGHDVFKTGVSVAPVTNWKYYDDIYTERYMRTPATNGEGYENNAPEKMAGQLTGKFLLIHGTADDNVHLQNTMMLTDALIKANKDFDSEYYPNKAHGISGGNTRYHLYKRMTDFILQNL